MINEKELLKLLEQFVSAISNISSCNEQIAGQRNGRPGLFEATGEHIGDKLQNIADAMPGYMIDNVAEAIAVNGAELTRAVESVAKSLNNVAEAIKGKK